MSTSNNNALSDPEEEVLHKESDQTDGTTSGQGYDDGAYWDNRYGTWAQDPYDWLVEYPGAATHAMWGCDWSVADVDLYLEHFLDKEHPILCPGCGNAPLHPQVRVAVFGKFDTAQMYEAGYRKQICLDTSQVVIGTSYSPLKRTLNIVRLISHTSTTRCSRHVLT